MAKPVVFTDLDGTLLDGEGRVPAGIRAVLDRLEGLDIPLVFATAKTWAETAWFQQRLGVSAPVIVENGSAIYVPEGYFPFDPPCDRRIPGHRILELGVPYRDLRAFLAALPALPGLRIRGFGDMGDAEVAALTGLDLEAARRARQRDYDETLVLEGLEEAFAPLVRARGLRLVHGGRFHHLLGDTDKGRALRRLAGLYARACGPVRTVALGNADNDLPLLEAADLSFWLGDPGALPPRCSLAADWGSAIGGILGGLSLTQ